MDKTFWSLHLKDFEERGNLNPRWMYHRLFNILTLGEVHLTSKNNTHFSESKLIAIQVVFFLWDSSNNKTFKWLGPFIWESTVFKKPFDSNSSENIQCDS